MILSTEDTDDWGDCNRKHPSGIYRIKLDWTQTWPVIETWMLPHEYAHVRAWGRLQAGLSDHDDHYYLELRRVDLAAETTWAHTEE